ncbi:MAG: cation:dicarboxylase symporter family transporter [Halieaceae bacterium]|jgi:Na+/H+-dicarboxylate symporter/ABC-type amino acid transport substrate-binding protein|nr:cation:dicarboxylase symporter family transporter [Halieaceae bacterium]
MSLSLKILLGLAFGIVVGLFFGELVADMKIMGDLFVGLLQITVLPYIMVSLMGGLARLELAQAKKLALKGGAVLVVIWLVALAVIFISALSFPDLGSSSFFSSAITPEKPAANLLELYIPANIFFSLSSNMVPAVVLFSLLIGFALITVKEKDLVLPVFDGLAAALTRVNHLVVGLTPYGIFFIAAAAAGTITLEEVERVQVYLITYVSVALFVTFWVFPGLISVTCGIPFKEVLSTFKDSLVTAFATGTQFVVLPQIAENCKALVNKHRGQALGAESAVDVIVPVSFNFPSLGKLLVLLFVLFSAWFTGTELSATDRASLAVTGLFSLFGSINVAVPYLLDSLQISSDMFQLFLATGIVVGRFGAMLAALHIIALGIIATFALCGGLRLQFRSVLQYVAITLTGLILVVIGLRAYFSVFVPESPSKEQVLARITTMEERVPAKVLGAAPATDFAHIESGSRLDKIIADKLLTVGYRPQNLPCTFLTSGGALVGFDVEMAHLLAEDLGVSLQFIPFEFESLGTMLDSGQIDIAMSCIAALPDRYAYLTFSRSYLDLSLALVVPDHERAKYENIQGLKDKEGLTIALVGSHYFKNRISRLLPDARTIILKSAEEFFSSKRHGADVLLLSAEEGAAYAYRYPKYTVIRNRKGGVKIPASYAVAKGDLEMAEFIGNWIDLKKNEGVVDQLYDYWMLGGVDKLKTPRWSVVRDVLHWVD